jgi:hypothetical protein
LAKYTEVKTVGPIEWAKIHESTRDMEGYENAYVECEGAYTVNQILDKEQFDKLKAAGTMKKPNQKRLLEGELVVKFERKHLVTTKDGRVIEQAGGAPKVTDSDGQPWDLDINGGIGNGSMAEVSNLITSFQGQDGKTYSRTSLLSVKILEHVPIPEREDDAA